ncbi:MAG: glycosyltransferase [Chloroflexi bacterium]|nr:glycosyltransferase [Chloroflexota bacterium]
MRLLFVADGRSPIARNWIRYFAERGDEVYLASTFECDVDFPLKRLEFTPVAFSAIKKSFSIPGTASSRTLGLRTAIRHFLGPLTIPRAARKLRAFIKETQPDLIHAMRIPYEGMLATSVFPKERRDDVSEARNAVETPPLLVSVWGNDFTLHAPSSLPMKRCTRRSMMIADALHADCARDIRLAHEWGLKEGKPTLVTPGNGGIRTDVFYPPEKPVTEPVVVNPRGFRAYVCNDAFFKSIPLVLAKRADARFVCSTMAGESQAIQWTKELGIEHAVQLNPPMPHEQMAELFRGAQVVVSPSIHDGTPNTLLEGMACGCFPVAGDLESIREWITPGQNGLLVDPNDPQAIASAILIALEREDLRREAASLNQAMIAARAEYTRCMGLAGEFYEEVIEHASKQVNK